MHAETDDGPADESEHGDPMKKGPKPRVTGVAAAREEELAEVEEVHLQNYTIKIRGWATGKRLAPHFVVIRGLLADAEC